MNRIYVKLIKWISNKFGYKIIMLKGKNGTTTIEGDREVLPYVDISGYFFKKEPIRRNVLMLFIICYIQFLFINL